jgi:aminobenzoyl-glutamate utilization protein B
VDEYYQRILDIADGADKMVGTTHKVRFLTGVHNGLPNRTLGETIVTNMKEIGAPTYDEEELEFARKLGETVPREQKRASLTKSQLPDAMELLDVDLNTRIYEPWGEGMKGGGSSDVADVAWNMPTQQFSTVSFVLGAPGHSWQHVAASGTSIGEKSSVFASKVMATTTLDLLMNPDLLQKAKEEWAERMKGRTYKSPLPEDLEPPLDQLEEQH